MGPDAPQAHHPLGSIEAMSKPTQDPLQPLLRDAQAELRRRLDEACQAEGEGIENESAARIRQLEDSLLSAAVAAENTLTLRRHIERREHAARKSGEPTTASESASPPEPAVDGTPMSGAQSAVNSGEAGNSGTGLREFKDSTGQTWRAWMITPGLSRIGRTRHFLGEFQLGWVCFENPAAGRRRRLPGHPERWSELSEQELERLLRQAISVRERHIARKDAPVPVRGATRDPASPGA
jgi:hypothetical protein